MEKAQVGDLIRVTENDGHSTVEYKIGDIIEIVDVHAKGEMSADYICYEGANGELLHDYEFVIHRKAGEEESESYCDNCGLEEVGGDCTHCSEEYEPAKLQDAVNSPNHYTQGKFETIEIIEEITKGYSDGYVAYCVGNALKYLARAPFKHSEPSEDISKAAKYLAFASEYLDAKSTQD